MAQMDFLVAGPKTTGLESVLLSLNKAFGKAGRGGGGGAVLRLILFSGVEVLMSSVPGEVSDLEEKLKSGVEA